MAKRSKTIVFGTPQTISAASTWSEFPASAFVRCYEASSAAYIGEEEVRETRYYAESLLVMNPDTGTSYGFQDPAEWTTAFEKEETYDDRPRFYQTQGAIEEFTSTFSDTNLSGHQFAVASTAFQLSQLGYEICVLASSNEIELIRFTRERSWNFRIVSGSS